jgi:hypothetical protein
MTSQGPIIGVLLAGGDKCLSALAGKKLLTHGACVRKSRRCCSTPMAMRGASLVLGCR